MDEHRGIEPSEREAARHLLAGLLAQRRLGFFDRLAARAEWRLGRLNAYWVTLSRRGRRAIGRRLAPALLGVSLLGALVMSAAPVHAAAITVDIGDGTFADDGFCSLPEAIVSANIDGQVYYSAGECEAGNGNDVITLTGDVTLTGPFYYGSINGTGLPSISTSMTIEGNGYIIGRDSVAPNFRIISNTAYNPGLTLNDVTISGGALIDTAADPYCCEGGGIWNAGRLTLNDSTVSGNQAENGGGGIFNGASGYLTLNGSTVSGNRANDGAGIYNDNGYLTLNDSVVSDNQADLYTYYGRGGGIFSERGQVGVNQSTVSGNYARGGGGGIYMFRPHNYINGGTLTMTDSVLSNNTAYLPGGGGGIAGRYGTIEIAGSDILDNESSNACGGISVAYGSLTLTDSTVGGNSTPSYAGGICGAYSDLTLTGSTISGNSGRSGGILLSYGSATLTNSTVSGNTASIKGGGILNSGGSLTLTDSTVSENSASISYGPNYNYGDGGGIANQYGGTATLTRSIVSGNSALVNGDEVFNDAYSSVTAANDNVFGHSGQTNAVAFSNVTPSGSDVTATSDGNDPTPLAAILSPLADNGGPTMTHALPTDSPAIDIAPAGPATDQRGYGRPVGPGFDAGAYEFGAAAPGPLLYVAPRSDGQAGGPGGLLVKRQDIAVQDLTSGDWAMHFDGSDVGVNKPIAAFTHLPDGSLLLAFTGTINLPGAPGVTASDIVHFTPFALGDATSGTFALYFDGSDVGLTISAEKIDALDVLADGRLLISTTGNAQVPLGGGVQQKASDEDLLAFTPTTTGANTAGTWALHFDGSTVPGLAAEDIVAAHLNESTGDLYLAVLNGFTIGGVGGNGKDILKLSPSGGGYSVTRFWRGPENGFNLNLSGIELD